MNESHEKIRTSQILITLAAFVVVVAGMTAAKVILVPFLLAAFLAIISAPPLFWMQNKGLPKWIAFLIVILGVLLLGLLAASMVGSSINDFSKNLPLYETKLRQQTDLITVWFEKLGVELSGQMLTRIFDPGVAMKLTATLLNGLGNVFANTFLIMMIVIFMLLEASSFPQKLMAISGGRETFLPRAEEFFSKVNQYMAIKTWVSLATGLLVFLFLLIIGVDYPLLWGLLAFLLNYIPNIGSIIAAVPVVLLTTIQLGLLRAAAVAAGYLIINLLMSSAVEPRFMGRGLGLSTLVVFLSLLFWGWVLGPVGMLLSVPLTMTVKIALDSRDDTRWLSVLLGSENTSTSENRKNDTHTSQIEE